MLNSKSKVVHQCSPGQKTTTNAALLVAAYLLVIEKFPIHKIKQAFGDDYLESLHPFRDAGVQPCRFPLTVIDCLNGLKRAIELGWYQHERFNATEFDKMLKYADLSWVVPGQILAFASPTSTNKFSTTSIRPCDLMSHFFQTKVKGVIRLNDKLYDANEFERENIKVHEMEFPDGSCPKDCIISDFIDVTHSYTSKGQAVAVHCRAGLGRTGTLIGCYIMHKFDFEPKALIAWMRLCRSGMVVGD